ncbi:unnamed protein product, partial [Effrenium voratum]
RPENSFTTDSAAEMTLQLATQWFPQVFAGSTLQREQRAARTRKIHKKLERRHEEVAADPNTTRGLGPQR